MTISTYTLPIQRFLICLNIVQSSYMVVRYFRGAFNNKFSILEGMFNSEMVDACTISGCWRSIVPFLGSTYISIVVFSVVALWFRPGRELRLILIGLASVHIVMAIARLLVIPPEFYLEGVAMQASTFQFVVGILILISSTLPYSQTRP